MKLRRLLHAFHLFDFWQDLRQQAGFIQQFKGTASGAFSEHLHDFIANALAADH